jgi:hypothetical protein
MNLFDERTDWFWVGLTCAFFFDIGETASEILRDITEQNV